MAIDRNAKLVARRANGHQVWLARNGKSIRDRDSNDIDVDMRGDQFRAVKVVPNSLSGLALFHGVRGFMELCDCVQEGWLDVDLSVLYRYWEVKLHGVAFSKETSIVELGKVWDPTTLETRMAAHVLMYAVAMWIDQWQTELREILPMLTAALASASLRFGRHVFTSLL